MIDLTGFKTWLEEWDKAPSTIRGYLAAMRAFARWFVERHDETFAPVAVTPQDVREYRDGMIAQKRSPNTTNYHLSALSAYFAWARDAGLIEIDPTERIKQMAVQKGAPRWMDRREKYALDRALRTSLQLAEARAKGKLTHPAIVRERRNTAIVTLMLNAGLRVSEIVNLTLDDLTLNERSGHVVVRSFPGSAKRKYRQVPLNADARRTMRAWLEVRQSKGDKVFVGHGRGSIRLTTRSVGRLVRKYAEQAKLEDVSPHTLRHTCGHNLVEAGVSIDRVASILGHEKLDTTAVYTMPSDKELQREVEKIAGE